MTETAAKVNGPMATITRNEALVEYVPFGGKQAIKLSVAIVRRDLVKPTKNGVMPSDSDCMKFLMLCRARELNPWEGDAYLVGYDGKNGAEFSLITAHQAFGKRAEVNPKFDGMESGVIVEAEEMGNDGIMRKTIMDREGDFLFPKDVLLGGWATVYVKDRKIPTRRRLNLAPFCKDFAPLWKSNPAGMICKCAEVDALRATFPTVLGGLFLEAERMPTIVQDVEIAEQESGTKTEQLRAQMAKRTRKLKADTETAPVADTAEPSEKPKDDYAAMDLVNDLIAKTGELNMSADQVADLCARVKCEAITKATEAQVREMMRLLGGDE
jgi:phage recombination protein Bet